MTITHLDVLKLDYPDGNYPDCSECHQWEGTVWRFKNNMLFGADPDTQMSRPFTESGEQDMLQYLAQHPEQRQSDSWRLICPGCRDAQAERLTVRSKKKVQQSEGVSIPALIYKVVQAYGGECFLCGSDESLQLRPDNPEYWNNMGMPRTPGGTQRINRIKSLDAMGCPPGVVRVWCATHANRYAGRGRTKQDYDALKTLFDMAQDNPAVRWWLR